MILCRNSKKKLHTKKVGHCGTLDPDATGVLVVCVNKATKAIQFLMSDTKVYGATLSLGKVQIHMMPVEKY